MPFSTAPALLVGLGARILLDTLTRSGDASVRDFVLIGVWQGVGLNYASRNPGLVILVASGIFIKLFIEFSLLHDTTRFATTLLGVALGALCTEFLSQLFDTNESSEPDRRRKKAPAPPTNTHVSRRERIVQFRSSIEGDNNEARRQAFRHNVSDITSIDSTSDMIGPSSSMSPLDRDIAALRTRASLADSERRRFKEERKWAISQGNVARASQMKWQVKRYTALMQSFHREADAKLIGASGGRPRHNGVEDSKISFSKSKKRDELTNKQAGRSADTHTPHTHGKQPGTSKPVRDAVR